jgi:aspartokinase
VTGVAGRQGLTQVHLEAQHTQQPAALSNALAGCDILFQEPQPGPNQQRMQLLVSCENLTDPSVLVQQLRLAFADTIAVIRGLGSVAAVGLGLGEQPIMSQYIQHLLQAEGLAPVKCFTTPDAVIGVIPEGHLKAGLSVLHQRLVETPQPAALLG